MLIHSCKMVASSGVSLTETLFLTTQLHQYRDILQHILPEEGISEKMFPSSKHGAKFKLDNRLTYKVNKFKKGKTMKTKKVINPNIMFTVFSAFSDRSPGQVRKDMIEWIESNMEMFKSQVFIGMAVHDIYFDSWINQIKSNDCIGDEFCIKVHSH